MYIYIYITTNKRQWEMVRATTEMIKHKQVHIKWHRETVYAFRRMTHD
jgi:hypothetical protein